MRTTAVLAVIWPSVVAGHADTNATAFGNLPLGTSVTARPLPSAWLPDDAAEIVGHWGVVFTRKELVRVPVLRDRPTVSLAGPGMVTKRGPLFSTVLRDEEVPMEVDFAVSLQIDGNGHFTLMTERSRAASPTNDCVVRSATRRDGAVSYANGKLILKSNEGLGRSANCEGTRDRPDTREGEHVEVYAVRREGATLVLTAADGEVWPLRRLKL